MGCFTRGILGFKQVHLTDGSTFSDPFNVGLATEPSIFNLKMTDFNLDFEHVRQIFMLGNPTPKRSSSGWLKTNCTNARFSTLLFVHRSQKSMARYTLKRDCSAGKRTLHQNWDSWVSFSRPCRIQVQYLEVTFPLMSICSSLSVALPARLLAARGKGLNVER